MVHLADGLSGFRSTAFLLAALIVCALVVSVVHANAKDAARRAIRPSRVYVDGGGLIVYPGPVPDRLP